MHLLFVFAEGLYSVAICITLLTAGVQELASLPKPPFPVTRHVGSFGQQMGEYVIGQIIAREKGFRGYWSAQQARKWCVPLPGVCCLTIFPRSPLRADEETGWFCRELSALSIGILGVGEIGKKGI